MLSIVHLHMYVRLAHSWFTPQVNACVYCLRVRAYSRVVWVLLVYASCGMKLVCRVEIPDFCYVRGTTYLTRRKKKKMIKDSDILLNLGYSKKR